MKAVAITRPGGPEVLELAERPDPVTGPGECLIRVAASGINRPDVLQRKGAYPPPPGASELPGLEVAGEIVAGDDQALAAHGFKLGDEVCALVNGGGYAELCTAPIGQCLPVPKGWTLTQAATLPETCFTVWANVFDRVGLKAGETLLIHGGSSGIGVTAIQMARAMGARVLARRTPAAASGSRNPAHTAPTAAAAAAGGARSCRPAGCGAARRSRPSRRRG